MTFAQYQEVTVSLDPYTVSDETLEALRTELSNQTDHDGDIETVQTFVLSVNDALDSHAKLITTVQEPDTNDTPTND